MSNILTSNLWKGGVVTASLTPAGVSANTSAEQTFTVSGLALGDHVTVVPPGIQAGAAIVGARVSAADTLSIQFMNSTAGSVTPTAGDHLILWFRPDGTRNAVDG